MPDLFWRLQTVALRCPRSRQYNPVLALPASLHRSVFARHLAARHHEKAHYANTSIARAAPAPGTGDR
jgi:hypothetical protein